MTPPFWTVASYGYPNPFGDDNAKLSWEIFNSFVNQSSYQSVKDFWQSPENIRKLDHAAVESRKASFEEFGLLYVLNGSDNIVLTPGGQQLLAAAAAADEREFAWIGINLLFRFPLCGPPRRMNSSRQANFLVYWFLWAALFDLDDHLLWPEFERVICLVQNQAEALEAVTKVRALRASPNSIESLPLPVANRAGKFYNSLNQVMVHASLYYQLFGSTKVSDPYGSGANVRHHGVVREFRDIVQLALGSGASGASLDCEQTGQFVSRIPSPPEFTNEIEYFSYLGASVPSMASASASTNNPVPSLPMGLDSAPILTENHHYRLDAAGTITGDISTLCRLGRKQRVILSHDLKFTYKVQDKRRTADGHIELVVSKSKPIVSADPILPYIIEDN